MSSKIQKQIPPRNSYVKAMTLRCKAFNFGNKRNDKDLVQNLNVQCPEGGDHIFTHDYEYDLINPPLNCEKCGIDK